MRKQWIPGRFFLFFERPGYEARPGPFPDFWVGPGDEASSLVPSHSCPPAENVDLNLLS